MPHAPGLQAALDVAEAEFAAELATLQARTAKLHTRDEQLQYRQEQLIAAQQEQLAREVAGDGVKSEASTVEASTLLSDPASPSAMIALDDSAHIDLATPALVVSGAGNPMANGEYSLASSLHHGCPFWVQRGAAVEANAWRLYWSCGPAEVGWSLSTDFEMPHYLCEVDQPLGARLGRWADSEDAMCEWCETEGHCAELFTNRWEASGAVATAGEAPTLLAACDPS